MVDFLENISSEQPDANVRDSAEQQYGGSPNEVDRTAAQIFPKFGEIVEEFKTRIHQGWGSCFLE